MKTVKFISYDGRWPSYCHGTLILEINGVEYKFHPVRSTAVTHASGGLAAVSERRSLLTETSTSTRKKAPGLSMRMNFLNTFNHTPKRFGRS